MCKILHAKFSASNYNDLRRLPGHGNRRLGRCSSVPRRARRNVATLRPTTPSLTLRNRLWHTVSVKLESVLPLGFRPAGDFESAVVDLSLKPRR
jgi:hypothetical protein